MRTENRVRVVLTHADLVLMWEEKVAETGWVRVAYPNLSFTFNPGALGTEVALVLEGRAEL